MDALLGIEIGGTKLMMVIAGMDGVILERRRFAVSREQGAEGIRKRIESELPALTGSHKVRGVGVGFGGPIHWQTGRIARSHQVEGWSDFDLAGWLHQLTGASVSADNDANVAALGEARHGAGKGRSPVFYVTLGSGVGGGLIVDGKIYHGAFPGEAEIGHLRLDREGTILESRCSGWSVDRLVREAVAKNSTGRLAELVRQSPGTEARHLPEALRQKDPVAERIVRRTAEDLALGLSHVVHLIHPEVIVLGGGLSHLGEPWRSEVAAALGSNIMEVFKPAPPILLSSLKEDVVPVGAIELAREIG